MMEKVSQYIRSTFDRFDFQSKHCLTHLEYLPFFSDIIKACVLHAYAKPDDVFTEELVEQSFGKLICDEANYQMIGGMLTRYLCMHERDQEKDNRQKASGMPFLIDSLETTYSKIIEMMEYERAY